MTDINELANPIKDTCSLTGHATLLVGDKLYVQGGRMIYSQRGYGQNPYLRVLDISGGLRAQDVPSNLETLGISGSSNNYDWTTDVQNTRAPLFWLDKESQKAYIALGARLGIENVTHIEDQDYNPGKAGKMWTADLDDDGILSNWEEQDLRIGGKPANLVGTNAQWYDEKNRAGYAFGGSWLDYDENEYTNQLITFNAETGVWTNDSTPYTQSAGGFMEGISLDDRTVLIAGAGVTNGQYGLMDTVRVYDTKTKSWYSQRTNGVAPSKRWWTMCSSIVAAQDGSSYQIILYGGANSDDVYGDVWALSIPSFTWSLLSEDITSSFAGSTRYGPSCNLVKKHTLLVFGGDRTEGGGSYGYPICDDGSRLAWFFDLNLMEWVSALSSDEDPGEYRVPEPVYQRIGGSAEGGATLTEPPGGFNQVPLSTVFAQFATRSTSTSSTTSSTQTGTNTNDPINSPPADSGSKLGSGAIAGIAIGVVAVIAALALGIFFLLRRRRAGSETLDEAPLAPDMYKENYSHYAPTAPYVPPAAFTSTELDARPPAPELVGSQNVNAELPGSMPPRPPGPYDEAPTRYT